MGIKDYLSKKAAEAKAKRKETRAFKSIVAKRNLNARRQAFAKASEARAIKEGEALANRPTIKERLTGGSARVQRAVKRTAQPQRRRKSRAKRTINRVVRRTAKLRPRTRRTQRRAIAPRTKTIAQSQPQQAPQPKVVGFEAFS